MCRATFDRLHEVKKTPEKVDQFENILVFLCPFYVLLIYSRFSFMNEVTFIFHVTGCHVRVMISVCVFLQATRQVTGGLDQEEQTYVF